MLHIDAIIESLRERVEEHLVPEVIDSLVAVKDVLEHVGEYAKANETRAAAVADTLENLAKTLDPAATPAVVAAVAAVKKAGTETARILALIEAKLPSKPDPA
jgi:hypothetical protein